MKLIKNDMIYWEFIRHLRNDPHVKKGFISQREIGVNEHWEYMNDFGHCYYVCVGDYDEENDFFPPLGYCGVINGDIRVAVSPEHHGKGVGTFMIKGLMEKHPRAFAKVKINNAASLALFEKCGFKKKYYILEKE